MTFNSNDKLAQLAPGWKTFFISKYGDKCSPSNCTILNSSTNKPSANIEISNLAPFSISQKLNVITGYSEELTLTCSNVHQ